MALQGSGQVRRDRSGSSGPVSAPAGSSQGTWHSVTSRQFLNICSEETPQPLCAIRSGRGHPHSKVVLRVRVELTVCISFCPFSPLSCCTAPPGRACIHPLCTLCQTQTGTISPLSAPFSMCKCPVALSSASAGRGEFIRGFLGDQYCFRMQWLPLVQ